MKPILRVLFRVERGQPFEVTALFDDVAFVDDMGGLIVYAHVGQHSTASNAWYNQTRRARPAEYHSLLQELRSIYSDHWHIVVGQRRAHV
jgi:hypothetical protein